MSHARNESAQPRIQHTLWRWPQRVWHLLVIHNPLYLISACLVLHGTAQLLPRRLEQSIQYNPWPLLGLSIAYLVALAAVAVAIVRIGRVWDDARTILLIVVGLFVELSIALDAPLAQNVVVGRVQVVMALAMVIAISEALVRGLGLRIPMLFRVPYVLGLTLVYLYPLILVHAPGKPALIDASWAIYLFSVASAAVLLTLLPAIRRGRGYVATNGSPWAWPWFPWVFLGMLGAGVCLRGYVLSLSFDPVLSLGYGAAMRLESSYGAYFLVPTILAVGVLLLEAGRTESNRFVQHLALAVPVACIALSITRAAPGPYGDFLAEFAARLDGPLALSLIAASLFYGYCCVRGVPFAETLFVGSLFVTWCAGTRVGESVALRVLQTSGIWAIAGLQLWRGLSRRDSARVLAGSGAVILGLRHWGSIGQVVDGDVFWGLLALIVFLTAGLVFDDWLAMLIRKTGAVAISLVSVAVMWATAGSDKLVPGWEVAELGLGLVGLAFLWACLQKGVWDIALFALGSVAWVFRFSWVGYVRIRSWSDWEGVRSYLAGFAVLVAAAAVSLAKGRMGRGGDSARPREKTPLIGV
jgi:hypothetical protein